MLLKRRLDLSLSHKLPLWGSLLIISAPLSVAGGCFYQAMGDLPTKTLDRSESLGRSLRAPLPIAMMHGDKEAAYARIQNPSFQAFGQGSKIEQLIVLNESQWVFASTSSQRFSPQTSLTDLGPEFRTLSVRLRARRGIDQQVAVHGPKTLMALPIEGGRINRGYLVLVHAADLELSGFVDLMRNTVWIILPVLSVALPVCWYWG